MLILGISKSGGDPPPLLKLWGGGGGGGGGLKIVRDDFIINFKLMENTLPVYLAIFNSGHLLLVKATWLISYLQK